MKVSSRNRPPKAVGYRANQWKGSRAAQDENQRQQARRSRLMSKCRRVLLFAGWGAGLAGFLWGSLAAWHGLGPVVQRGLEIREVRVEGIHQVTKGEVLNQLALKPGVALHQVNLASLAERLQAHPWITEAVVERWPLHELRITILERKPAAIARTGSDQWLLDQSGIVLARVNGEDNATLPLLSGIDAKPLLQGEKRLRRSIHDSIELAKAMAHWVDGRVEIDLRNQAGPVASAKGVRFQFAGEALLDQWERYTKVRAAFRMPALDAKKREGSEVDLRYDNRVIVRERG